ncbi:MAG TPA: CFI-box-CTERM domain-containing protein [Nitrosarchaeum sp.]|nr:CFI-box-CTERM domain-containing protein [Nitrosarchaeum sp.]
MIKLILISLLVVCVLTVNYYHKNNLSANNDVSFNWIVIHAYGEDGSSDTSTKYLIYKNDKYGFTLEYPSSWAYREGKLGTSDKIELANFVSNPNTYISISKLINNNEFRNLTDQQYLDKMIKKQEEECNQSVSLDDSGVRCYNFKPLLSTVEPNENYLSYVISYTYTDESSDRTVTDKSKLVIQIPDHDEIWNIIVSSTIDDLPNHLEEIGSTLNSFTILTKPIDVKSTTSEDVKKGGGCLIATATYGSELAPQVQQLRELRDNSLLQTGSGTSFMNAFNEFYYSFSPTIADWERESPVFKEAVKITLTPMISSLSILNYVDMGSEVNVLGYGISLILLNVGMYFVAPGIVIHTIRKRF